ncbi:MAG: MFS transporter [Gammaproteobacteria bacterium]
MPGRRMLRSLRHRNYRLYYFGQLVSLHGRWMQTIAQSWLVYRMTQSSLMLGFVSFVTLLPMLLFGLIGGVVADRLPRRKLLIAAHALAMLQAMVLGVLTLGGWIQVWQILVLAFCLGLVQAFEMPARHSFVPEMVPREDLANAIALNSSVFNIARFLGPALAGWLVALVGEGLVFLLNGVSILAVIGGLSLMRLPAVARPPIRGSTASHLWEGLRYAWQHKVIRATMMMVGLFSLAGGSYVVLLPVFAKEVYGGGPETLGMLYGAVGAGALLGALRLAHRAGSTNTLRGVGPAGLGVGMALVVLAAAAWFWLALSVLAVTGFALTTLVASSNTSIQMRVPDALRGRVMALFSVVFLGLAPIGSLAAGGMAHVLGAPAAVGLLGVVCLAGAGAFMLIASQRVADEHSKPSDAVEYEVQNPNH